MMAAKSRVKDQPKLLVYPSHARTHLALHGDETAAAVLVLILQCKPAMRLKSREVIVVCKVGMDTSSVLSSFFSVLLSTNVNLPNFLLEKVARMDLDRQLDISSVLQGGYATPLTRELQAERHLTK
jgi:hypothetical protein